MAVVASLAKDISPQVRRECAIALRGMEHSEKAEVWATLAELHDGKDRWYLEALGIGAHQDWNDCLSAWLDRVDDPWKTAAGRDIIWRSRGEETPEYLLRIVGDPGTPAEQLPRFLRSFDFLPEENARGALLALAFGGRGELDEARHQLITGEALSRIKTLDPKENAGDLEKLSATLDSLRGSRKFIELVGRFNLSDRYNEVLQIATEHPSDANGIEAIRMLLAKGQLDGIRSKLKEGDEEQVLALLKVLGNSTDNRAVTVLEPILDQDQTDYDTRREALRSLARIRKGAEILVELAEDQELPQDLQVASAAELNKLPWKDLRERGSKVFPLSPSKENKPLPSIPDLARVRGEVQAGKLVFAEQGTCAKCHIVQGQGKQVGPDLSEIGSKLSREALYESILYPSAGISHNFETYAIELADGNVVSGVLVSQSDEEVQIKDNEAVLRRFPIADVELIEKQPISLMPADLHKLMTEKELIDLIEYLTTLKSVQKGG